jgi:cold shock CspA family protein
VPIGRLVRWNDTKKWGFVRADSVESGEDIFIHSSVLRAAGIKDPRVGDALAYSIGMREGRECVLDCSALNSWRTEETADSDGWPSHLNLPTSRPAPPRNHETSRKK